MYKLQINELTPGQKYYVKVRAKAPGYATSEWSSTFEFEAEQDQIPPERVRNLTFTSEGDSFIARWEAPELNMDGTPCTDLSHYKITLVNFDASRTVHLETSNPEFTIDFNSNKQLFGTPSGIIEITVSAVDRVSNVGPGSSKIAQNMPPAKVNNVTAQSSVETVTLKWDPSVETDIEKYNVYVSNEGPGFAMTQATLAGSVAFGTNTFAHTTMSLSPLYFKVTAVDKFLQQSPASDVAMAQPKLTTDFDKTPPGLVENLTVTQTLADDQASAIARLSFSAAPDDDLDKYEVEYRKTGESVLPWSFLNIPSDQTSAEIKPLPLSTDYDFKIRAVDFNSNKGVWSSVVVAPGVKKTSLPPAPTNVIARGGMTNLMVTWTESSDPAMANWAGVYEVHVAKTPTFSNPSVIKTSSTLTSLINLDANTVYYVRVRSIDPFNNIGPWSNVESENTGEVESGENKSTFETTDPDGIGHTDGDIWYKVDAEENIIGMWEFFGNSWIRREIKNLADDSVTSGTISADAVLAGHIKAGEIEGSHLKANTALINDLNIRSSLTIDSANGHIKSSNYSADGSAGFYMDQQQLIINQGKIKAAAIELQDSQNLLPSIYAGLNHSPKIYDEIAISDDGAITHYWPNAGRAFNGALGHDGVNTIVMLAPTATSHYIYLEAGQKYIVSGYLSSAGSETGSANASLGLFYSDLRTEDSGIVWSQIATATSQTEHVRVQFVFAPTSDVICAIMLKNNGPGTNAPVWSCFQVERVVGASEQASPWTPPGSTSIEGESITTGAISSNSTISTPNGNIARWSIDTSGNARFADATIDGKLIVGADVSNKEATSIQSDTYAPGLAGWAIKGNGDVEFNDGTFRGILNLGAAANESVKPTMTASVSSIKLYTDETTSKDIDVASIQGVTYAYSRTDATATGTFVPDLPNENKAARYYFGPTTDKAVNIQVHDGPEDRAVYVSNPPVGVTLTSLRIGELTNPGAPALDREKQGLGYVSTRAEVDPDTPNRQTSIRVEQSSGVQLRSPFYPEVTEGKEYPESTHILRTNVDFKAPLNKNLIYFSTALPDATAPQSVTRIGRTAHNARAYEIRNAVGKAAHLDVSAGVATATKKHVFSTYVDTLDATDDVAIYAFANGTPLKPLGDNTLEAGQTEYQYAPSYASPDYRYEFETSTTSYSNVGTGTQALTRTQGSTYISPAGALYTSGNVRYTAAANYNITNGMSLSMWIMPTSSSGAQVIFHRASSTTREIWINYEAGSRTFSGGLNTGTAWTWEAPGNLVPNEWTHVTIVIPPVSSGTGNIVIYINGEIKWFSADVPTNRWSQTFSAQPYYLFGNMQLNSFYQGAISEPMIFHRMIQPTDVSAIYESGNKVVYRTGGNATQSQNGILVGAGSESNRVAFEYTPTTSTATNIKVQTVGPTGNKVFIYKLQLEKASYLENNSLSPDIRSRVAPTPWTTNGSSATSAAALTLRSEPATDAESWTYGSLAKTPYGVALTEEASRRNSPAELELTLSSSYTYTGGPSAGMTAGAIYKWSTAGVSYPGSPFPYLPTAASIYWDYTNLTSASRPQIGGSSSYLKWTINNTGLGAINTGGGRSIRDNFNRSDEDTLGYPWIREGNPAFYLRNNYTRRRSYGGVQTGIPENFVYHSDQLETINQEVTIKASDTVVTFGSTYRNNTVLICNYDPGSGDGIFFRNKDHSNDRRWQLIVRVGGVITYSTGGTYSTAMSDGTVLTLSRNGNRLTVKKGTTTYFNSTVSVALPTGQAVGFTTDSGINDDFIARDLVPGSTAPGLLRSESINVNNNRGITVTNNGAISVNAPGYYMLTVTVGADFGGHINRTYWLWAREYIPGGYRDHRLGGPQNRGVDDFSYMSGSTAAYMTGTLELIIETDTNHVARINWAEMQLVRVA